ncbi:uncharacterized protein LOC111625773 [Centruroides sculpturatus]|uniref:uncharacterized protein LOC111625773 n=1 Tax=Centruroides sculpturatus TaxID=218467 RepID=UPI000C6D6728|nr:uncharacterized protein LOC111625773 [Centruroides sculpturatus]
MDPGKFVIVKEDAEGLISCTVIVGRTILKHYNLLESITTLENILQETDKMNQEIKEQNKQISSFTCSLSSKLEYLPLKQQLAIIKECLRSSERKSTKGMMYDEQWLLECITMRMKSPRLYKHMRINKILVLPSKTCIKHYLKTFKAGFGFIEKVLFALKEKAQYLNSYSKLRNLLFDEIKLSESLQIKQNGYIQGFVNFKSFTTKEMKEQMCDHCLILLFQPFVGDWVQIVEVFGTRKNVKGNILAKLLIEAIIQIEKVGLYVDSVTGDGATWNRSM